MAEVKKPAAEVAELTIEEKLRAMYKLQMINSEIDKIRTLRGELPLEVQDLEDEIAGLETRIEKLQEEIKSFDSAIGNKKNDMVNSKALIKKYEEQQNNVRNNREFDSLSKEIEFQTLEIELSEKRIKEFTIQAKEKSDIIEDAHKILEERKSDLNLKKAELEDITSDTQKEEEQLLKKRMEYEQIIEERLLTAYRKIRKNARNGLAVVSVERDACGGCFNQIPPQRQLDIRSRKKIIVCEYCGRILVDVDLVEEEK
ncbi:MAG TPA: C4-type zinc ribbon domain-containing protein [Bacteroidales bacterium]|nr:C4-type zinc ribbon domain-containing protein [Bacteroidales bacterium]